MKKREEKTMIKLMKLVVGLAAAACLVSGAANATNLISNPDFTTGTGWTFVGSANSCLGCPFPGGYINNVGLGSSGAVEQTVSTVPGTLYDVDFFLVGNGFNAGDFQVSFGNTVGFSTTTPVS